MIENHAAEQELRSRIAEGRAAIEAEHARQQQQFQMELQERQAREAQEENERRQRLLEGITLRIGHDGVVISSEWQWCARTLDNGNIYPSLQI